MKKGKSKTSKAKISANKEKRVENKKFLSNVQLNLTIIIILMVVILCLFAGIIYFQNLYIKSLQNTLNKDSLNTFTEYELKKYKLRDFSEEVGEELIGISRIYVYLQKNGYEDLVLEKGFVEGKRYSNCELNELIQKDVCDTEFIQFDQSKGIYISYAKGVSTK